MKNSIKVRNTGFTLIEMMVTIAIVGVFASIALPSFSKLIENNRITGGGNELVSHLLLARSEALKRSNPVTICPSNNQASCVSSLGTDFSGGWVVFSDCNGNGDIDAAPVVDPSVIPPVPVPDCIDEVIKVHDGFDSLYLTNRAQTEISFGFSGRLAGNPSTFDIGPGPVAADSLKSVVLSRIGRVRTQAYEAPPPPENE